jgi:hypothetical protein
MSTIVLSLNDLFVMPLCWGERFSCENAKRGVTDDFDGLIRLKLRAGNVHESMKSREVT